MSMATNATVKISWQAGNDELPRVDPGTATISTQGQVTWQVSLPAGYTVKIDFTAGGTKGPFPLNGQPDNPSQGVFEGPSGDIVSAPASAADGTDWKYGVGVYQAGGKQVAYVDPIVRIRNV